MKKSISLLLVILLIMTAFTACNNQDTDGTMDSQVDNKDNAGEKGQDNTSGSNIVYEGEYGRIVQEPIELKIHLSQENKNVIKTDLPVYQHLSEVTGISIIGTANESATDSLSEFNLSAADGFPDDIYAGNKLTGLFNQYGAEGAFVPINEYLDQMPNFSKFMEEDKRVAASITAPDGNIYYIPYMQPDMTTSKAYFIRKDWLDKLNLPVPDTIDDLEKALTAMITSDPNGNGEQDEFAFFARNAEGIVRLVNLFGARAFGNDNFAERYVPEGDGLYNAWMQPEFFEGIKKVSEWYDLGIIDNEYLTNPNSRRDHFLLNDLGGMTYDWIASTSGYANKDVVEGFELIPMAPPTNTEGERINEHIRPVIKTDGWAISAQCEDVEAAIALFDMMFTEYGRTVANFGVEGQHWEYVDGLPTFTDAVMNNAEGKPVNLYLRDHAGAQLFIGFKQDYEYERQWTSEAGLKAIDIYGSGEYDVPTLPALVYTDEEFDTLSKYLTNINTYMNEKVHSWISMSADDITDDMWAEYLDQIDQLGIKEVDQAYMDAYTRFLANSK